jgi:hypothetical protein
MLFDPIEAKKKEEADKKDETWNFLEELPLFERWMKFKQRILLRREERRKKKLDEIELMV